MTKKIEDRYKKLTDIEHVLLRPGRYLGSVKPHTAVAWVVDEENQKFIKEECTWNPALLKMFDEVISNSVDHSKRPEGAHLDTIKVKIDQETGKMTIWDNGGIPVAMHSEHNQYVPEMIFGELRSGSNFDDEEDSTGTGQNGEGSSLVNIFSSEFIVKTADGKNKYRQRFAENLHKRGKPTIDESSDRYTEISFTPDYERLETSLDDGNYKKLVKRVYDIAGCNPELKITLNGKRIRINSFKDYIKMYTDEFVFDTNDDWAVGISATDDGFQHISFVNTTETIVGGTHIDYIANQIVAEIRDHFKKKHKVDVKPSEIKNHMTLYINASIVRPRYDSQTKEKLITEPKEYKTEFTVDKKFINKVLKSSIIQDVLDWVHAKQQAAELAELRKKNKELTKTNPRRIEKFSDANEKNQRSQCILFLTEGDSASKAIQSARDTRWMGSYPLKGKPVNVSKTELKKLIGGKIKGKDTKGNQEFMNIMTIMGLEIGTKVNSPEDLYFGKIGFMTDADVDGHHIVGLLINMLHHFWPELFEMGVVYRFRTPLLKVTPVGNGKKKPLEFFSEAEFIEWKEQNPDVNFKSRYFKGLGTSKTVDFKEYLSDLNRYLIPLEIQDDEDKDAIDLAFNEKRSGDRKVWLKLSSDSNNL